MTTDTKAISTALISAGIINAFLLLVAADANYGYSLGIAEISPAVRAAATAAILGATLVNIYAKRRFIIDPLFLVVVAYSIIGLLLGLNRYGLSYELVRHTFGAATIAVSYWAGINFGAELLRQRRSLSLLGWATAITGIFVLLFCLPTIAGTGYSLSPAPVLLTLDALLVGNSSPWLAALILPIIVMSNKRAFVLAVSGVVAIAAVHRYFGHFKTAYRWALTAIIAALVMVILTIVTAQVGRLVSSVIGPIMAFERSERMLGMSAADPVNMSHYGIIDRLTSLRLNQLQAVHASLNDDPASQIIGNGFGSTFEWRYWSVNLDEWQSYVMDQADAMPAYFMLTGGVLFSILITALVLWSLFRVLVATIGGDIQIGMLFVLGFGLDMLLSIQPNAPLFWLLLGGCASYLKQAQWSLNLPKRKPARQQVASGQYPARPEEAA